MVGSSLSQLSKNEKEILLKKKKELHCRYKELLKTQDFQDSITKGTNDRKSVFQRFEYLEKLLKEIIGV